MEPSAAFLERSRDSLEKMAQAIAARPAESLAALPADRTALAVVDMIVGFATKGALSSPRVAALTPAIDDLMRRCLGRAIPVVAFADTHPADAVEFGSYPPHCLAGTEECRLVPDLAAHENVTLIPKNSTNGFLEPQFQEWLTDRPERDIWILTGDCTDICIYQLATSLKAHFNRLNRHARIIVPVDAVDTFDADSHHGDLMHLFALYSMIGNGVEVVARVH